MRLVAPGIPEWGVGESLRPGLRPRPRKAPACDLAIVIEFPLVGSTTDAHLPNVTNGLSTMNTPNACE